MNKINVDALVAIDIHTHAETSTRVLPDEVEREMEDARGRYFRYKVNHPTIAQMVEYYRSRKMAFVVFTVDTERGMGFGGVTNEELAESAAEHTDNPVIDPDRGSPSSRSYRSSPKCARLSGKRTRPRCSSMGTAGMPQMRALDPPEPAQPDDSLSETAMVPTHDSTPLSRDFGAAL
jgi:hypothetical protein